MVELGFLLRPVEPVALTAKGIVLLEIVRIELIVAVLLLYFLSRLLNFFPELFERNVRRQRRQWLAEVSFDSAAVAARIQACQYAFAIGSDPNADVERCTVWRFLARVRATGGDRRYPPATIC